MQHVWSVLKDKSLSRLRRARSVLEFVLLSLDPRVGADLLFPGDRRLALVACARFVRGAIAPARARLLTALKTLKSPAYRVLKRVGVFSLARQLTGRELRIICFHGISLRDEHEWLPALFISPETLRRRLEALQRQGWHFLRLEDALRLQAEEKLPRNSLVVTIDDGFHNNHRVGLPLFQRCEVPVTIFVTTYYVKNQNPVFRLAVQYLHWKAGRPISCFITDTQPWRDILAHERNSTEPERLAYLEKLGAALGVDVGELRESRMLHLMTADELREMVASGLVDIQLHAHRHCFPTEAPLAEREITENRDVLEPLVGSNLRHFAYPGGVWAHSHAALLRKLGIETGLTVQPGLVTAGTSRFALPRVLVGEGTEPLDLEAELCGLRELARRARAALSRRAA